MTDTSTSSVICLPTHSPCAIGKEYLVVSDIFSIASDPHPDDETYEEMWTIWDGGKES